MKITFRKKTRISNNGFIGGGGGSTLGPSSLKFVPYDEADDVNWLIHERPIKVPTGVSEFAGVASTGDIIAKKAGAVIFATGSGGAGNLFELNDVNLSAALQAGSFLMYNGTNWRDITPSDARLVTLNNNGKIDISLLPDISIPVTSVAGRTGDIVLTKADVGLNNVDNTSDENKPVSNAQRTAIADAKKSGTDAQSSITTHASKTDNPHSVTKAQVGLSNVDNTSDANKPLSTAAINEFKNKADLNGSLTEDFRVKNLSASGGGVFAGDIVAKSTRAVVFAASDSAGGSQYLHQLLDVNIKEPANGDMLIYNASTQMWNNVNEIAIDGGTYSII